MFMRVFCLLLFLLIKEECRGFSISVFEGKCYFLKHYSGHVFLSTCVGTSSRFLHIYKKNVNTLSLINKKEHEVHKHS